MPRVRVAGDRLRKLRIATHEQLLQTFRQELAGRGFRLDRSVRVAQDGETADVWLTQDDDFAVDAGDDDAAELLAELRPFAKLPQEQADSVDEEGEQQGVKALRQANKFVKQLAAILAEEDDHRAKRMAALEGVGGTSWAAAKDLATKALRLMGATREIDL